ncbi:MAG: ABC-2 family transporter protein [Clostridia bacterium]|nr:ABC-2 family transporter protein [Clostridia bacterium]MBN2884080.1 ABC-2 family transporter protein [Clostridia bacterium]
MNLTMGLLGISYRTDLHGEMVFRSNFFMGILKVFLKAALLLALWTALYTGKDSIEGINLGTMVFYALASIVFSLFISSNIENTISSDIMSGNIAMGIAGPVAYPKLIVIRQLAFTGVNLTLRIIPYGLCLLPIVLIMKPEINFSFMLIISLLLSYVLFILYQMIFGFIAFWTMEVSGVIEARNAAMLVFSGSMIPLWFFPEWLFSIARFLPFQATFHIPLSMLIGKLEGQAAFDALVVQVIWLFIFLLICILVWRKARRKVVVNGG